MHQSINFLNKRKFSLNEFAMNNELKELLGHISYILNLLYLQTYDTKEASGFIMRKARDINVIFTGSKATASKNARYITKNSSRNIYKKRLDDKVAELRNYLNKSRYAYLNEDILAAIEKNLDYIDHEHKLLDKIFAELDKHFSGEILKKDLSFRIMFSSDASGIFVACPIAVFFPRDYKDAEKMINLANKLDFKLVLRGGGVGYTGSCVPVQRRTIVMSTEKLNEMGEIKFDKNGNAFIWTQAGVITEDVDKKASEKELFFAVDPISKKISTVGGNLAQGAGGPSCFEFGSAIDNVLAYKFIDGRGNCYFVERKSPLPISGRIKANEELVFLIADLTKGSDREIKLHASEIRRNNLAKDVMNKYLKGLPAIQKEGADGIVTDICWALHKKLKIHATFFIESEDFDEGHELIMKIIEKRNTCQNNELRILKLEYWDKTCAVFTERKNNNSHSFAIEFGAENENFINEMEELINEFSNYKLKVFKNPDFDPWKLRTQFKGKSLQTGFEFNEDISIDPKIWPEFNDYVVDLQFRYAKRWEEIKNNLKSKYEGDSIFEKSDFVIAVFGHFVDGNAHFTIPIYRQFPEMLNLAHECIEELFAQLLKPLEEGGFSGSITGGHGIGLAKLKILRELAGKNNKFANKEMENLRGFKSTHKYVFDPNMIFNLAYDTERNRVCSMPDNYSFIKRIREYADNLSNDSNATYNKEIFRVIIEIMELIKGCVRCGACRTVCHEHNPEEDLFFSPYLKNTLLRIFMFIIVEHMILEPKSAIPKNLWFNLNQILSACSGCGFCKKECPAEIDTGRAVLLAKKLITMIEKRDHILISPNKKDAAIKILNLQKGRTLLKYGLKLGKKMEFLLPEKVKSTIPLKLDNFIDIYKYVKKNFRNELKEYNDFLLIPAKENKKTVVLWLGCGEVAGKTAAANLFLVNRVGFNVIIFKKHYCCGFPHYFQKGVMHETLKQKNLKNISSTLRLTDTLLVNCPSCRVGLSLYGNLQMKDLLSEVFDNLNKEDLGFLKENLQDKVIGFQRPCHLVDATFEKYKKFFNKLGVIFKFENNCCGSVGGNFNGSKKFKIRIENINQRLGNIDFGTSTCTICTGSLQKMSDLNKSKFQVENLAVLISENLINI